MKTTAISPPHFTSATTAAGERALVLHGGGSAGNAWEIGVIAGLFDAGLDVTRADLTIGTSAGSTVAAQIMSSTRPPKLFADILAAAPQPGASGVGSDRGGVPRPVANHMERTDAIFGTAADAADVRCSSASRNARTCGASTSSTEAGMPWSTRKRSLAAA